MSHPLRYTLVGMGDATNPWVVDALPRLQTLHMAEPAAVVSNSPQALKLAQERLHIGPEQCYADVNEAYEKRRADFTIIAVPPALQEKAIELALMFDQHVFSDGPVADSIEAACRVYRNVRGIHRKKMAVHLEGRFEQAAQTLGRALADKRYGRLNYIFGRLADNVRRIEGKGRFRDEVFDPLLAESVLADFDVLRSLTRQNVKSVYSISWRAPWVETRGDSNVAVMLEMSDGVHCLYEGAKANASCLSGAGSEYFRAECEQATLELDHRSLYFLSGGGLEPPRREPLALLNQAAWGRGYAAELYCGWLSGGHEPPNTLKDYMYSAATLFAAMHSAKSGKRMDVKEYLQHHLGATRPGRSSHSGSAEE